MSVTATEVQSRSTGMFGEVVETKIAEAGRFEVWICAACGYSEWYATRLEELAVLAATTGSVRLIDRDPRTGPYRT